MGKLLSQNFEPELSLIKDKFIQKIAREIVAEVSDMNFYGPASASGKYHPKHDLGIGGLVRHCRCVYMLAARMMACNPRYDNIERQSVILAACLVHDLDKFSDSIDRTHPDHAILMATRIRNKITEKSIRDEKAKLLKMADLVETHMSRWGKGKNLVGDSFEAEIPTDEDQWIVCYADMVASMKPIHFEFDSDWNIVQG